MPLVFAYGSNINHKQMVERCPSAKFKGLRRLHDWELDFVGFSQSWCGGVATVRKQKGAVTEGVAWEVSDTDLARLDRFEGVPRVYRRVLAISALDGELLELYIHNNTLPCIPSKSYLRTIRKGMKQNGIKSDNLNSVLRSLRKLIRALGFTEDQTI